MQRAGQCPSRSFNFNIAPTGRTEAGKRAPFQKKGTALRFAELFSGTHSGPRRSNRRRVCLAGVSHACCTPFVEDHRYPGADCCSCSAQDFKKQVIYQIVTDRFFDGDASNNNPSQSAGLFDATKTNWHLYWGGDLAGIQQKMSYIKGLGATAIWISPPLDNLNLNIPDGSGNPTATYHGYAARDFKRIEEHFGSSTNTWTAFDNLVSAAHANGIKVIVDFAPNHSNDNTAGEVGSLYDNGTFLAAYNNDPNGYFHHNPNISNFDDRYQLQYDTLFNLSDLNQENATIDAYLKAALQQLQQHGVDAFRIDAVKHVTWGWEYSMVNSAFTTGPSFFYR